MKTYEVYIRINGRSPQWVTVQARDQYHMREMVSSIYGTTSITNYRSI